MIRKTIKAYPSGERKDQLKALQAESVIKAPQTPNDSLTRRVYFYGFLKSHFQGSLTVEAALVIPLFLSLVMFFISIFEIYRVQTLVKTSMHQCAMELGMYAYEGKDMKEIISTITCQIYAQKQLPDVPNWVELSVLGSSYEDGVIKIRTDTRFDMPILMIPLPQIVLRTNTEVRAWVGRDLTQNIDVTQNNEMEMVYIAENESVYHTSSKCTHLDRNISGCSKRLIEYKRNQYGERYHACEKCVNLEIKDNENVFYTEKGDCYHKSEFCSGIKRTVILVEKTEVSALDLCERCKGREQS